MGEKIGYARVSTREQNLSSQVDALNNAGCIRIFTDKISGKEFKREGLTACLDYLRADDTLVIYRLDRLGRSVKEMLELCAQLEQRRIKLVSFRTILILHPLSVGLPCKYSHHWPSITAILFSMDAKPESRLHKNEGSSSGDRKVPG